ncbi:putative GAF sensor protein [Desulfosarcina cetonica]|uniref:GAF domain-containing protein n=1 Tax=Desulfosarcina cetonica TaxID=90730 RepID=UPI0006CFE372|nr:GAF domain-containing protein [Desulfosarcina cetonica]VTR67408.1 putative GAF sensor protein [Desulfosarcina cetonica]
MSPATQHRFHLRHFKAISLAMSQYEDLYMLLNHFVEGMCMTFKIKGASVLLHDEHEGQLFRVASYGISTAYLDKGPLFIDKKDEAFIEGRPVFINDMHNDPRVKYGDAARSEGITAMLSFPIKCRSAVVGLVRCYHSVPIVLHEEDVDSIAVLCQLLGLVIENNGLKHFVSHVRTAMASLPLRLREGTD